MIVPMVPGVPHEARWIRTEPRRTLSAGMLERIVHTAFPHSRAMGIEPLSDGFRNSNFKLRLDSTPDCYVLRIYEHDASLCQKEVDLIRLLSGSVPVPQVIHAEAGGFEELPPFVLMRYVEGISFRELKLTGDREAIAQAAHSAGESLAVIGRTTFPKAGWLGPGPSITAPLLEGMDPSPRFVDLCLASPTAEHRVSAALRDRIHAAMWSHARELRRLNDATSLVHGDFNKRNLLVRPVDGSWAVVALLDWEFAVSGSPLADLGSFLRHERTLAPLIEPHFSAGYLRSGGALPEDWRRLSRIVGLTALCESLTHDALSYEIVTELVELICAAAENRDPRHF